MTMSLKNLLSASLLLLVVVVLECQSSPTSRHPRWMRPCDGATPELQLTTDDAFRKRRDATDEVIEEILSTPTSLSLVSTATERLRHLVRNLRSRYIQAHRFLSEIEADECLRTYPAPHLTSMLSLASEVSNIDALVTAAYEGLARLSVFVGRAKHGEQHARGQHISFNQDYEVIENDPSGGLYPLLCHLKAVMLSRGLSLSDAVENDIRQINLRRISNNSVRYVEDYAVLDALEKLLRDLSASLSLLS